MQETVISPQAVDALSAKITTLNSNKTSLHLWIGEVGFTFSNSDNAAKNFSDFTTVNTAKIVGVSCFPKGYARATFGTDSTVSKIIMQAHQSYNVTLDVMVCIFYTD